MKNFSICGDDSLPTRIKACCDGTSGLSTENEVKMIEHYEKSINNPEPPATANASMPGFFAQAANFISSAVGHALEGFPATPDAERERRLNICRACPEFEPNEARCKQCGCFMNTKAGWLDAQCPLNKWVVSADSKKQKGPPSEDSDPK